MATNSNNSNWLIYLILGLVGVFVLIRLVVALRFFIFVVLAIGLIIGIIYWIRSERKRKAFEESLEGQIAGKLDFCKEMLQKNQEELSDIEYNYRELQSKLKNEDELESETWKELKRLSDGFASERSLRQTKIDFFRACIQRLEKLQRNHQLAAELEQKQQKLKELREGQLEELAQLESLRSDLNYDQAYLETIDRLSLRLLDIQSPEQARALQKELEEMTRDMRS